MPKLLYKWNFLVHSTDTPDTSNIPNISYSIVTLHIINFLCIFFINTMDRSYRMNKTNPSDTLYNTGFLYSFGCMHNTHSIYSLYSINNFYIYFLLIIWKSNRLSI